MILAAGLDARSWRLPWPDGVTVYELDGDQSRGGLGWVVVVAFAIAVVGTLVLARFGEAPAPEPS